jgi:hypothetical protein
MSFKGEVMIAFVPTPTCYYIALKKKCAKNVTDDHRTCVAYEGHNEYDNDKIDFAGGYCASVRKVMLFSYHTGG